MSDALTGKWMVTRFCCRSGNCVTCFAGFIMKKRKRVTHAALVTEAQAKMLQKNWAAFEAVATPMTEADEFEYAAERCATLKVKGTADDLPFRLSQGVRDGIESDPDVFQRRVREYAYAHTAEAGA